MKKSLLFLISWVFLIGVSAQVQRMQVPASALKNTVLKHAPIDEATNMLNKVNPYVSLRIAPEETIIGTTIFDLQSNSSSPSNRIELFPDSTIGAIWAQGTVPPEYVNRGTGYNYFNGSEWMEIPTNRVEEIRTGYPSYSACGPTGEAIASHASGTGMNFYKRDVKGTGEWVRSVIEAPAGQDLLWPRLTSSGDDFNIMHLFAIAIPTEDDGPFYEGLRGALVYYRSADAGATWQGPTILPGMTSNEFVGFNGDAYSLTAKGNNVVLLYTDSWTDMFIMKSTNNGESWEKTVIWEHPVPRWDYTAFDTIYSPDGAGHATLDSIGKVHVAFGITRVLFEAGDEGPSWFPLVDGLAYWNEDLPTWTGEQNQQDVLNPDNVFETGNLIGFVTDLNSNGELDFMGFNIANFGLYGTSLTSMPQLVIDDSGIIYAIYSSVTETFNNGVQNYRHLWITLSRDGGANWDNQIHLGDGEAHILEEMVYPSVARFTQENLIHVIYQADEAPGVSVAGMDVTPDDPTENFIYHMPIRIDEVLSDEKELFNHGKVNLSSAYPNPLRNYTSFNVSLDESSSVVLEVYSLAGQKISAKSYGKYSAGNYTIDYDATSLKSGIYLYKFIVGEQFFTGKITVLK